VFFTNRGKNSVRLRRRPPLHGGEKEQKREGRDELLPWRGGEVEGKGAFK